jgi:hypothetical protein
MTQFMKEYTEFTSAFLNLKCYTFSRYVSKSVLYPQEIRGFSGAFLSQGYTKMSWKECHPKWTMNVEMIKDGNYHA